MVGVTCRGSRKYVSGKWRVSSPTVHVSQEVWPLCIRD